jgi:hypothetical protein
MSDMIPFSANMVPDYIRNEGQSDLTKSLMTSMGGTNKRISIRGKVFRLIVNGEEVAKAKDHLDLIIVNVAKDVSRTYYAGAYDPAAEAVPPTCWSADSKTPHASVEEPQASNCNDCPMNIAGSGQGTTRACRFKRRIAVVLADDLDSGVHMLELPATSLFGKGDIAHMPYEQYFKYVASQNHSIDRLITRLSFDDDADTPKLFFSPIGFPARDALPKLIEFGQSPEAKLAVTLTVYQADKGQKALPSLKDAIKSNGGVVDEDEEPKVKAKKPVEEVTTKPDLQAVMSKFVSKKRSVEVDDE